jgi:peptide/nickel transport system substrate-binding protein
MAGSRGSEGDRGSKGSRGFGISRCAAEAGWFFSFTSCTPFASSISLTSLFLVALLALASCSHDVPPEPGVVNFLIESMPVNLDPRIGTDAQSERIDGLIFDSLIELDAQRNPQSDLAETWEMPDPRTYVFHLRSGVKFHDGRPLTSADVKYTFNSIINDTVTSPKKGSLRFVTSIETPDANTVIFRLSEPSSGLLPDISRPAMGVVPVGAGTDFAEHPIGTGPFRFVSAQQDDSVVLERNATYFRAPPKIDQVRFRVVPEAIVRALELRKGTADLEETSLTPDMIPVLRSEPGIEVAEQPGSNYAYIAFNFDDTVLRKREVRQALALATDRDTIIRYLLRGQARKADGPLPPNSWAYEPNIRHYGYDPQEAESLLDSAGFPRRVDQGGVRLKLTIKTSTEESTRLLGEALQEQWRKVGVELELKPEEIATLLSDLTRGSFQLSTLRWIGVNNDPEFFEFAFSSKRFPPMGANRGRYRNAMLDALMDQARVQTDREKRRQLYSEIQKEVAEELPYLSLWHFDNITVHRNRISKIELAPSGDFDFLRNIEAQ